ncbi:MAG: hypothetical protein FJ171_08565 [Gammaproteobacteria bacterium]|nr:hypothetical protein [Gammaproteobacteria bacterium]
MVAAKIPAFPYDDDAYAYEGDALRKAWDRLHRGDREPFPADARLQSAWRAFHRGEFAEAIAQGAKLKSAGSKVATKAAAKGGEGERKPEAAPTQEAVIFASLLRGVHW